MKCISWCSYWLLLNVYWHQREVALSHLKLIFYFIFIVMTRNYSDVMNHQNALTYKYMFVCVDHILFTTQQWNMIMNIFDSSGLLCVADYCLCVRLSPLHQCVCVCAVHGPHRCISECKINCLQHRNKAYVFSYPK